MSTFKLSLPLAEPDAAALADYLSALESPAAGAATAFEVPGDGWRVEAYFPEEPDRAALERALGQAPVRVDWAALAVVPVPAENWVARVQALLKPVRAGRFLVHGSHDRGHPLVRAHGRLALEIEAGEAFGTAHHATTRGCLLALDDLLKRRRFAQVADVGAGSGVLAIAAARADPGISAVASDIDPVATRVAAGNARLNRAGAQVRCVTAAGLEHPLLRHPGAFDLMLANILAAPLLALAPSFARAVRPGGVVVLSGLLAEQAGPAMARYRSVGFRQARARVADGWATVVMEKAS